MPEPERRFWNAVRAHRFHSLGFRREAPIAGYIADFICHERKLVVEIDGDSHGTTEAVDAMRTVHLAAEGYRVVRFSNHDIMDNLDGVMQRLAEVLDADAPPSQPSPTRGEGANARSRA